MSALWTKLIPCTYVSNIANSQPSEMCIVMVVLYNMWIKTITFLGHYVIVCKCILV